MCFNPVILKINNKPAFFNCGHCSSCQQLAVSQRAQVLINTSYVSSFFFHLTFDNRHVYFVQEKDFYVDRFYNKKDDVYEVPVYRDVKHPELVDTAVFSCRPSFGTPRLKVSYKRFSEGSFYDKDGHMHDNRYIGILYYKEVQKFLKRLRKHLSLSPYSQHFDFVCAGEYGPTTFRPHYHIVVLFKKKVPLYVFKRFLRKSWQLCSAKRLNEFCEISINPWKYINQYISLPTNYPSFLKEKAIRPRITRSVLMGFDNPSFALPTVVNSILNGRPYWFDDKDVENPYKRFPFYVYKRYFGFINKVCNLTYSSFCDLLHFRYKRLSFVSFTESGDVKYRYNLFDISNNCCIFTASSFNNFTNWLFRFQSYFPKLSDFQLFRTFHRLRYLMFKDNYAQSIIDPDRTFITSSLQYHQSSKDMQADLYRSSKFNLYVKTSKLKVSPYA